MLAIFGFIVACGICLYFIIAGIIFYLLQSGFVGRFIVNELILLIVVETIGFGGLWLLFENAPFTIIFK